MTSRPIDRAAFEHLLSTRLIGRPPSGSNELWDSIGSTNTRAAELARDGAAEGTVILARQQSLGRGRMGRQWVSPADSGLYLSTILRPDRELTRIPVITLCIGVAAARAVFATTGVHVGLKWVNDLVCDGKKLGGILAEIPSGRSKPQAIIIGVGINTRLHPDDIPEELRHKVAWLEEMAESDFDINQLAAELCFQIEEVYERLLAGRLNQTLDEWRALSITLGKTVQFSSGGREHAGTAIDITDSGTLIVNTDSGRQELSGGEISIRNVDGSYC